MVEQKKKTIAVIGAGVFGLSLAVALRRRGHDVLVFDQYKYNETEYLPNDESPETAASVDHNKIFRASYGTKLHYQRLALEARDKWLEINKDHREKSSHAEDLFVPSGMLRVQPAEELSQLEQETLSNMERDGLRDTQFVLSDATDRQRATEHGWKAKLLEFKIFDEDEERLNEGSTYEAVLDSLAGFTRCGGACAYYQKAAEREGVQFRFGPQEGTFQSLIEDSTRDGKRLAVGLRTKDGKAHEADVVVVAAGSSSTQILPELSYHMESSAGSIATFQIPPSNPTLWTKFSPENFPVLTWHSAPRRADGKDMGSVYVLPRTPEGLVKIGYRGIKFTNFQPAPRDTPHTQDGKWSIPLPPSSCTAIPRAAVEAIRHFVDIFLPDFKEVPFASTRLCWYTDTLDNSFLIDHVPTFAAKSVFVATGGSGHGAKFMPVLGEHAADILELGEASTSPMRPFWRWREDVPRVNGLEEGPEGKRNIGKSAAI